MSEVNMPKLSDTMEEGTIVEWKKSSGDEVHKGDVLAEVESDKATFDLEAESDGTLEIIVEKGVPAKIGAAIARIGAAPPRNRLRRKRHLQRPSQSRRRSQSPRRWRKGPPITKLLNLHPPPGAAPPRRPPHAVGRTVKPRGTSKPRRSQNGLRTRWASTCAPSRAPARTGAS